MIDEEKVLVLLDQQLQQMEEQLSAETEARDCADGTVNEAAVAREAAEVELQVLVESRTAAERSVLSITSPAAQFEQMVSTVCSLKEQLTVEADARKRQEVEAEKEQEARKTLEEKRVLAAILDQQRAVLGKRRQAIVDKLQDLAEQRVKTAKRLHEEVTTAAKFMELLQVSSSEELQGLYEEMYAGSGRHSLNGSGSRGRGAHQHYNRIGNGNSMNGSMHAHESSRSFVSPIDLEKSGGEVAWEERTQMNGGESMIEGLKNGHSSSRNVLQNGNHSEQSTMLSIQPGFGTPNTNTSANMSVDPAMGDHDRSTSSPCPVFNRAPSLSQDGANRGGGGGGAQATGAGGGRMSASASMAMDLDTTATSLNGSAVSMLSTASALGTPVAMHTAYGARASDAAVALTPTATSPRPNPHASEERSSPASTPVFTPAPSLSQSLPVEGAGAMQSAMSATDPGPGARAGSAMTPTSTTASASTTPGTSPRGVSPTTSGDIGTTGWADAVKRNEKQPKESKESKGRRNSRNGKEKADSEKGSKKSKKPTKRRARTKPRTQQPQ
jgi:hypothetical protein